MTPEDKLNALFAAQTPPARDLAFQASVAERVARRRAFATVLALLPWIVAATAAGWALSPVLPGLLAPIGDLLVPVVAVLALIGLTLAVLFDSRLGQAVLRPR